MTSTSSLTPEQIAEFTHRGVLRLPGLLSADRVRRAREYVDRRLAALELWQNGAWWPGDHPKPQWPDRGLKSSAIGNKHPDVEALLGEPALLSAINQLLDGRAFDRELFKRPQLLVTLPNAHTWTTPTGWHVDTPRLASGRRPGIQLFTFLDGVQPCGGGTLAVAGSHRLYNEGRFILAEELTRLLRGEDFFHVLYSEALSRSRGHVGLLSHVGAVGNVSLEVVEFTGAPGDAYLMDLRLVHAVAPNVGDHPRIMATHRFLCADLVQELARAHGWIHIEGPPRVAGGHKRRRR